MGGEGAAGAIIRSCGGRGGGAGGRHTYMPVNTSKDRSGYDDIGVDGATALHSISQVLNRQQVVPLLRGFLQQLLLRQRTSRKENVPPRAGYSPARDSAGDFVENDYASIRELAHDEGLPGCFPR